MSDLLWEYSSILGIFGMKGFFVVFKKNRTNAFEKKFFFINFNSRFYF